MHVVYCLDTMKHHAEHNFPLQLVLFSKFCLFLDSPLFHKVAAAGELIRGH